jgi:hypothetical protein
LLLLASMVLLAGATWGNAFIAVGPGVLGWIILGTWFALTGALFAPVVRGAAPRLCRPSVLSQSVGSR